MKINSKETSTGRPGEGKKMQLELEVSQERETGMLTGHCPRLLFESATGQLQPPWPVSQSHGSQSPQGKHTEIITAEETLLKHFTSRSPDKNTAPDSGKALCQCYHISTTIHGTCLGSNPCGTTSWLQTRPRLGFLVRKALL